MYYNETVYTNKHIHIDFILAILLSFFILPIIAT